ncbi:translation initiation factor IF-3, mitochondrial-like [Diretmus argenteus]
MEISETPNNIAPSWRFSLFSTAAGDTGESLAPKKKKQDPRARDTIGSVGRKISQRHLQVIGVTGEDLGAMHRADAIRLMDEQGLKLVLVNEHKDPPVYRLMSGKQIHEERLRLREKQKVKAGPVQVKELTFSSDIGSHDLTTKLKQVQSWLEKKHHVKITMRSRRADPTVSLDVNLERVVQQLEVTVGYVSKPTAIRDGQAAMCVLRPPSAKELAQKRQKELTAGRIDYSTVAVVYSCYDFFDLFHMDSGWIISRMRSLTPRCGRGGQNGVSA